MSDFVRHEPMTRGEKKEVEAEPRPDYFPSPSPHAIDLMDACNMLGTILSLIEEGNIAGAWSYAKNNEHLMEKRLSLMDRCDECRADHRNCTCDQEEDKE